MDETGGGGEEEVASVSQFFCNGCIENGAGSGLGHSLLFFSFFFSTMFPFILYMTAVRSAPSLSCNKKKKNKKN